MTNIWYWLTGGPKCSFCKHRKNRHRDGKCAGQMYNACAWDDAWVVYNPLHSYHHFNKEPHGKRPAPPRYV